MIRVAALSVLLLTLVAASACSVPVRGTGDLGDGETLKLSMGETIVVGRSRHCDWSLKRTPAYLTSSGKRREAIKKRDYIARYIPKIAEALQDILELDQKETDRTATTLRDVLDKSRGL